jgi:hypothetical protein
MGYWGHQWVDMIKKYRVEGNNFKKRLHVEIMDFIIRNSYVTKINRTL